MRHTVTCPDGIGIDRAVAHALSALDAMPALMAPAEARDHLRVAARLFRAAAETMHDAACQLDDAPAPRR